MASKKQQAARARFKQMIAAKKGGAKKPGKKAADTKSARGKKAAKSRKK